MGLGDPLQTLCPLPYAPSPLASATDAGTSRVLAHSLKLCISSARVIESGTVAFSASSSACTLSGCLLE